MGVTDHFLSQPPFPQQNCTLGGAAPALNCPQAPGGRRPSRRSHPEDRPGAPGAGADVTAHSRCTRHSSGLGWPAGLQDQGRPPRTWARPGGPADHRRANSARERTPSRPSLPGSRVLCLRAVRQGGQTSWKLTATAPQPLPRPPRCARPSASCGDARPAHLLPQGLSSGMWRAPWRLPRRWRHSTRREWKSEGRTHTQLVTCCAPPADLGRGAPEALQGPGPVSYHPAGAHAPDWNACPS